ncbi:hypothetical protein [Ferruginibacter sp. SUN106]|uniref:hypothetical protein n=1 Tax=Ferruginibacter sp. SUN106 TaxID=2978348 RepID=UPI003D36D0A3
MEKQIRLLKQCTYFVTMKHFKKLILPFFLLLTLATVAQTDVVPVFKGAIKANREKTYNSIIKNSITQNLALPLSDSTEADWEDAFSATELINYKEPWVKEKIKTAFDSIERRSATFQRALLELCYTNYPKDFKEEVFRFINNTTIAKNFAMGAEYLVQQDHANSLAVFSIAFTKAIPLIKLLDSSESCKAIFKAMEARIYNSVSSDKDFAKKLKSLFKKDYLSSNTIVYSIQRKNRNYPGLVVLRGKDGNFVTDDTGNIFSVPQLARSITNLPGYLTNGNTPQGLFRMYGFAVSKSPALGPTENLQLTMPFETSIQHFLKDSSVRDTVWTEELYRKLLPKSLQSDIALYETYTASRAGRTEIIAHGTTVDPEYYKGQTYYPYTPTAGCLATKEIWSGIDGKRTISDQQKLVDAVKKAGGADGYVIVFEIDDQQKPVSINEVLPYIKSHQ